MIMKSSGKGVLSQYTLVSPFCYSMDNSLEVPAHLLLSSVFLFSSNFAVKDYSFWLCLFVGVSLLPLRLFCFSFHVSVHISQCYTLLRGFWN